MGELRWLLERLPRVSYAVAYGSAVMKQVRSSSQLMVMFMSDTRSHGCEDVVSNAHFAL